MWPYNVHYQPRSPHQSQPQPQPHPHRQAHHPNPLHHPQHQHYPLPPPPQHSTLPTYPQHQYQPSHPQPTDTPSPWSNGPQPEPQIVRQRRAPTQFNPLKRSFSNRHQLPPSYNHHGSTLQLVAHNPSDLPNSVRSPPQSFHVPPAGPSPVSHYASFSPRGASHPQLPGVARVVKSRQSGLPFPNWHQEPHSLPKSAVPLSLNARPRATPDEIDRQTELFTKERSSSPKPQPPPLSISKPVSQQRSRLLKSPAQPHVQRMELVDRKTRDSDIPVPNLGSREFVEPQNSFEKAQDCSTKLSSPNTPASNALASDPASQRMRAPQESPGRPPMRQSEPNMVATLRRTEEIIGVQANPEPSRLRSLPQADPLLPSPIRPSHVPSRAASRSPDAVDGATLHTSTTPPSVAHKETQGIPGISPIPAAAEREMIPLDLEAHVAYLREKERVLYCYYFLDASINLKRANHSNDRAKLTTITKHVPLSSSSPFSSLKPIPSSSIVSSRPPFTSDDRVLAHFVLAGSDGKPSEPSMLYNVKTFSAPAHQIPAYSHYVSSKWNTLVEGDKRRTFLPYLGENTDHCDADLQLLENKVHENQDRDRILNGHHEFAGPWIGKIDLILQELGTSTLAVLQLLIDEEAKAPLELPNHLKDRFDYRPDWIDAGFYEEVNLGEPAHQKSRAGPLKPQQQWQRVLDNISPKCDGRSLAAAVLACYAFMDVAGFSLWHVVRLSSVARKLCQQRRTDGSLKGSAQADYAQSLHVYLNRACIVCHAHDCSGHGEFVEDDDHEIRKPMISNADITPIAKQLKAAETGHDEFRRPWTDYLGKEESGDVTGVPWTRCSDEKSGLDDNETCSSSCFWAKSNRSHSKMFQAWSSTDLSILRPLATAFASHKRGSCAIARMKVLNRSCLEIWVELVRTTLPLNRIISPEKPKMKHPNKHWKWWLENSLTWRHDQREPFRPCNHIGKCKNNPNCFCDRLKISCEKSCRCSSDCSRRFRGCRCHAMNKACATTDNCDCQQLNRECDPDLCFSCGAHEVLDPTNRYNEKIVKNRCANVHIQRAVPKRTQLGQSELLLAGGGSGWGLYMGETCRKNDYIGEYIGEIVTNAESEQRGTIYNAMNLSYLFDLNEEQVLDSTPIGNKLRYINHQGDDFANCFARVMFCGGVQRIGMFASKNIAVGEELLFNYGDNFANKIDMVKKNKDGTVTIEKAKNWQEGNPKTNAHKKLSSSADRSSSKKRKARPASLGDVPLDIPDEMDLDEPDAADESMVEDAIEDIDDEEADDENEEIGNDEELEDDEDEGGEVRPANSSGKKHKSRLNFRLKPGHALLPSERMVAAWISRFKHLGKPTKSKQQEQILKKMLRARGAY